MKTYDILKNIALAAVIMAVSVQCAKEEIEPDSRPSGNTVTLTLKSPSADDTKTWLGDQGQVFWSENDQIYINDSWYTVVPDPDDPSVATVEGVTESESYMAFYPNYYYSGGMSYGINIPYYQQYAWDYQDMQANPMAGYTESGELDMYNLGAIIRIGVTGNGEQLDRLTDDSLSSEELEKEIGRSKAVTDIGEKIIQAGQLMFNVKKTYG